MARRVADSRLSHAGTESVPKTLSSTREAALRLPAFAIAKSFSPIAFTSSGVTVSRNASRKSSTRIRGESVFCVGVPCLIAVISAPMIFFPR